ncbi:TonB-dependent receptor [Pedobacter aquatilis]|uniref:SusC/RagA family TonB-linked outer membrane protein n=1 Tax=Pedobacter aquatilis TaxID=351343 RepID=UPI00292E2890|nr:TonB-dependent receptor [Pedobacter aquatilis]
MRKTNFTIFFNVFHWPFKQALIMLFLCAALHASSNAQETLNVSGTIKESGGGPLPGVTVSVKGLQTASASDGNGKYMIKVPANSTLVFSLIGYKQQELNVGNRTTINLSLESSQTDLETVVVVGYGTQKKASLTGAVAAVSGAEMNKRVAANPTQLLQGQLPGLQVTQASGEAGAEGNVLRVRGLGSYGAGSNPLVIIDGIPGSLTALNPESIESVTLLKDAASASIYGSRAANGVILVTTKQGKAGKTQVSYSYNDGVTSATRLPDFVYNSVQYMQLYNQAATNSGVPATAYTASQINDYASATDKTRFPDYNWLDLMLRTVNVQTHNLNVSGGSEKTTYNVGLGFIDQPDIMRGFSFKKYNMQFNLNAKVNDRINFGSSLTLNYGARKFPAIGSSTLANTLNGSISQDIFLSTLSQAPLYGPILPDGTGRYTSIYSQSNGTTPNKNPLAVIENAPGSNNEYTLQGNVFLDVKIIEGLQWKTSVGTNFAFNKLYAYKPVINQYQWLAAPTTAPTRTLDVGGQGLTVYDENTINPAGYTQLTYSKKINNHSFSILAGTQSDYLKTQSLSGARVVYPNNNAQELNVGGTGAQSNTGQAFEWALNSYYGRVSYDYAGKYLLEGSARYDGSSRFREGKKWGFFPSLALGYRISQEEFFKPLLEVVSDLKIRASIGKLGNQNIGNYPYQDVYTTGYSYPTATALSDGVRQTRLVDNNITWESTNQKNIGLDISFLKNKLNITAEYYYKLTTNILTDANIPLFVGYDAPTVNNGTLRNRGVEINASYKGKIGALNYSIVGNFQANRNKLVKFGPQVIGATTITKEGLPYGSFYVYEFDKIFQSAAEIAAAPAQPFSPTPGTFKFKDLDGNGVINESDRTVVSGIFPNYDYSLTTNFEYKNFDFSIFLYGSQGQKQYVNGWGFQPFNQGSVPTTDWLNAWTPENQSTTMPKIYLTGSGAVNSNVSTVSTYYLRDASFLKIKNIQLGYTLPAQWLKPVGISNLRVYFSGENLFIFTDYPGLDPERVPNNTRFLTHPQNKVYNFGARVTF